MAIDEEYEIVASPLCQTIERDGVKVGVHIYRGAHEKKVGA